MYDMTNFWFRESDTYSLPTVLLDASTGRVVKMNKEAISLLQIAGETTDSLVGKFFRNLHPICEVSKLSELQSVVVDVARTARCANYSISFNLDGRSIPYVLTVFPVRNLDGVITEVAIIFVAHTENEMLKYGHLWAYNIVEAFPSFVSMLNLDNKIVYSNPAAYEMLGYVGKPDSDALDIQDIHSPAYAYKVLHEGIPTALAEGLWRGLGDLRRIDGSTVDVMQTIIPVKDQASNLRGVATVISDMSTVSSLQKELAEEQVRSHVLFDSAPYGCIVFDTSFTPITCNAVTVSMFQEKSKATLLANVVDHLFEGFDASRKDAIFDNILETLYADGAFEMTAMHSTAKGGFVETAMTMNLLNYNGEVQIVAYLVDVSEQRKVMDMYEKLAKESTLDALTGVQNRGHFTMKLEVMVTAHTNTDRPLYLVILDIDDFKSINDTYGHVVGDEVLKGLGAVLRKNVRPVDVIARYGGEEFVILFENMDEEVLLRKAESLREAISKLVVEVPSAVPGEEAQKLSITASIGIAKYNPVTMTDGDVLCACADKALYRAKREGKNCVRMYVPQ